MRASTYTHTDTFTERLEKTCSKNPKQTKTKTKKHAQVLTEVWGRGQIMGNSQTDTCLHLPHLSLQQGYKFPQFEQACGRLPGGLALRGAATPKFHPDQAIYHKDPEDPEDLCGNFHTFQHWFKCF